VRSGVVAVGDRLDRVRAVRTKAAATRASGVRAERKEPWRTKNALTDVEGSSSGTTPMRMRRAVSPWSCAPRGVAGVDVRGSAPGRLETDLLDPVNLVEQVQAVVLSGGSVYGCRPRTAVVRWLARRGHGYPLMEARFAPSSPLRSSSISAVAGSSSRPSAPSGVAWRARRAAGDRFALAR